MDVLHLLTILNLLALLVLRVTSWMKDSEDWSCAWLLGVTVSLLLWIGALLALNLQGVKIGVWVQ